MERLTQRWEAAGVVLQVDYVIPTAPIGLVIVADAGMGGRVGTRNRLAAEQFHLSGLATMLVDVLTPAETGRAAILSMDVVLQAGRLSGLIDRLSAGDTGHLPVGLFGTGNGCPVALATAARRPDRVRALVCQDGRPDRVGSVLPTVAAPTLLIYGEHDEQGRLSGDRAAQVLAGQAQVWLVPAAASGLSEPGAWEQATKWAADWFARHLDVKAKPHG
jgi:pimeloyl-ACP methyl ester carboxylesterase